MATQACICMETEGVACIINRRTMEMKKELEMMSYEAPCVEVIEVTVEKGFAASTGGTGEDMGWG